MHCLFSVPLLPSSQKGEKKTRKGNLFVHEAFLNRRGNYLRTSIICRAAPIITKHDCQTIINCKKNQKTNTQPCLTNFNAGTRTKNFYCRSHHAMSVRGLEDKNRALSWNTYPWLFSSLCQKFLTLCFFRTSLLWRVTKHTSAAQQSTNRSMRQSTKWTERELGGR